MRALAESTDPTSPSLARATVALAALAMAPSAAIAQSWLELPREVIPFGEGRIRAVADFDRDGRDDLLVTRAPRGSGGIDRLRVLLQQPDGTFALGTDLPRAAVGYEAEQYALAGDVTGDGLPDVITSLRELSGNPGSGFLLYRNLGGGAFAPALQTGTASIPWAGAALSDWNGDGVAELVAVALGGASSSGTLRRWTWQNGAFAASAPYETPAYFDEVALGDIDGDGLQDTIYGDADFRQIYVIRTRPNGDLGATTVIPVDPSNFGLGRAPICGDVDGDGDQDVVVTWLSGPVECSFALLDNDGSGALTVGPTTRIPTDPGGYWTGGGNLADWDGDGDLDLLLSGERLLRIENRGSAGFGLVDTIRLARTQPPLGAIDGGPGIGAFDMDNDGDLDFVGGRVVYRGDRLLRSAAFGSIISSLQFPLDFDDDGAIDLLDSGATLWRQRSASSFERQDILPPTNSPFFYGELSAIADFDGDGWRDLIAPYFRRKFRGATFLEMRLLTGTPGGASIDRGAAATAGVRIGDSASFLVAHADFDGDGDVDLAVTDGWWENDGTGRLVTLHADWSGTPVQVADVDGDGRPDILTRSGATTLRHGLWRNRPGGFVAETLLDDPEATSYARALLVDLDDDGDLDFACGTTAGPAVVLRENRSGTFDPPVTLASQDLAFQTLLVDDFDGDGRSDLAAFPIGDSRSSAFGQSALVWLRTGPGLAYATPTAFVSPEPVLGRADLDGDGDLDPHGRYGAVDNARHRGTAAGRFDRYGVDQPAPSGIAPILGVAGPVRAATTMELRIRRARGAAPAFLVLGSGAAQIRDVPFPGLTLYVSPIDLAVPVPIGGPAGVPGVGAMDLPIAVPAGLAGASLYLQAFALDGARLSATAGMRLTFGM